MKNKKKLYGKSRTVPILKTKIDLYSWIMRGKTRKAVFSFIRNRTMPSEIVEKLARDNRKSASYYVQVSRALEELEAQGLIKCLNDKEKTGRLYQLTKKGENVRNEL